MQYILYKNTGLGLIDEALPAKILLLKDKVGIIYYLTYCEQIPQKHQNQSVSAVFKAALCALGPTLLPEEVTGVRPDPQYSHSCVRPKHDAFTGQPLNIGTVQGGVL